MPSVDTGQSPSISFKQDPPEGYRSVKWSQIWKWHRCRQSIPTKRVLSSDGSRDDGSPCRVAHAAPASPATAVAFAAAGDSAVVGEVPAHQSTTHHGRAAIASITHLGRRERTRAAVSLLLLLVAASDDEHSSAVSSSNADGADTDGGSGAFLDGRLFAVIAGVERVIGIVGSRRRRRSIFSGSVGTVLHAWNDLDSGVDVLREVVHELVHVVVDGGIGNLDVHAQRVNHALGVVELGQRGNVAECLRSVVRDELRHLNLANVDASRVRQGLG